MPKDKHGQVLLGDYLRAYAATPIITEGNLPGGGALFSDCTRAVETAEQLNLEGQCETPHHYYAPGATRCACGAFGEPLRLPGSVDHE